MMRLPVKAKRLRVSFHRTTQVPSDRGHAPRTCRDRVFSCGRGPPPRAGGKRARSVVRAGTETADEVAHGEVDE